MKFRYVDNIIDWTPGRRIRGVKAVSFEEYCMKEPFGGEPRLPETLLLESFLQLGNWLILLSSDFETMGRVARISSVRFLDSLRPGERVEMDVSVLRQNPDGIEFSGEGRVGGRLVIEGFGCLAAFVRAKDFINPVDMKTLFSEIHQPKS
jgi:3-hydroxymyristoyl/3-hydroxydecanoyl-(acyl carrier protein) dehydratase